MSGHPGVTGPAYLVRSNLEKGKSTEGTGHRILTVGEMQQHVGSAPPPDRQHQRVVDRVGFHPFLHRPAHHAARKQIDNHHIQPASSVHPPHLPRTSSKETGTSHQHEHYTALVPLHLGYLEHPQKLPPAFLPRFAVRMTIGLWQTGQVVS